MTNRLFAFTAALLLLCSGCGFASQSSSSAPPEVSAPEVSAPDVSVPLPEVSSNVEDSPTSADPEPTPEPPAPPVDDTPIPDEPAVPTAQIPVTPPVSTDFSSPVPESPAVPLDYFADAAFVGDSRTEGFWLYSGVRQGKLISATGLTVFSVNTKTAVNTNQTVLQALSAGSFGKIYLSFGINELGYIDTDSFVATYCALIDTVRATHPEATIYIQNLIPVNDSKARAAGFQGHVNCDRVRLYNELIAQIAQEKQVPLLDLYSAFAVDGQLPADASRDGVHLLPAACKQQLEYLVTHTVGQNVTPPEPVPPTPDPAEPEDPTPAEPAEPVQPAPESAPTETEATEI